MTFSAGLLIERGLMEPFSSEGPGMFAMPGAETIVPLLTEAGFGEVEVEVKKLEVSWRFEGSDELWIFASELQGPVALAIAKLEDERRHAVRAAIEERACEFATDGGYELPGCPSTSSPTEGRAAARDARLTCRDRRPARIAHRRSP